MAQMSLKPNRPAKRVAQEYGANWFFIQYAQITDEDYEWLHSVEKLTLRNVKLPDGFLGRLERLWWLDIAGGSATDINRVQGARNLKYLAVNQVRGICDLSALCELQSLRVLELYGLSKVASFPSLAPLSKLQFAQIGQMTGLDSLTGLLDAPDIRDLQFLRKVRVRDGDARLIAHHPTLERFAWFAEDVPGKVWVPFVKAVGLPESKVGWASDWFEQHPE
jgi:hypothetical protein